jgi:tetratricopeptide (TPR) repeat protein
MRKLLQSLGFSIPENLDDLMGLMKAAQQYRRETSVTPTHEVTRSTALAVVVHLSPEIQRSLARFGLRYEKYLDSIRLKMPVKYRPAKDVDIYFSFEEALVRYAESTGAVLEASKEVFAIAILEDAVNKIRNRVDQYELEEKFHSLKVDIERLSQALRSRALPFDVRRGIDGDSQQQTAADALRQSGRLQEALVIYESLVRQFPNDPVAGIGLADTLRESGRRAEALALYEQMVHKFPDNPVALTGLADTLRGLGQSEQALLIYQRILHQFPDNSVALTGLAETLRELGRIEQATATEEEAKRLSSEIRQTPASKSDSKTNSAIVQTYSTAPFYSDHPARKDVLNRKAVAETIATMIESVWKEDAKQEHIDRTFMVHLHGRWGSGKTSILNFLKDALLSQNPNELSNKENASEKSSEPSWIIVDFNAWRNQSLGPAWWTLMEAVYRQARNQLGGWFRQNGIRLIVRDRWWRVRSSYAPYALVAGVTIILGLSLIWLWQAELFDKTQNWFVEGWKIIGTIIGLIVAVFAFGHTYPIGSARTAKSYLELSRDPLGPLTKRYGEVVADIGRPVAVFIDDLDRCNAEFVVELLQTIQTLFRQARVLYVVAADRDWVCASYQQQYKTFSDTLGEPGKSLGHLFLEKVFQLSVDVPRLGERERNTYWNELINSRLPSKIEETKEIADQLATEFQAVNTESQIIEIVERYRDDPVRADIAASKGFQRMHSASLVREREHFLAGYAHLIEPNPRAMKRLLNAYGFRRGFDIQSRRRSDPDALVRWTILENRWPILADYLEGRSGGRNETEIIKALKKDTEVLEVAQGLTWDKLRPVASAPDQPPATEITPGADAKTQVPSH